MTGGEIIAGVLERTGVSEEDFFGSRRSSEMTAARAMAIQELSTAGLSAAAIGRIVRRNRVTVLYWQSVEMRAQRSAYYQNYNDRLRPQRKEARAIKADAARRKREQARRRKPQKLRQSPLIATEPAPFIRINPTPPAPPRLVEDARRRATAALSITASAFGDPPPGYSALDRMAVKSKMFSTGGTNV